MSIFISKKNSKCRVIIYERLVQSTIESISGLDSRLKFKKTLPFFSDTMLKTIAILGEIGWKKSLKFHRWLYLW